MQGWGTVLSVPLSLFAVMFTGLLLRHEIRVRREERDDADAAQARLVWLDTIETGSTPEGMDAIRIRIRNSNEQAVMNVSVVGEILGHNVDSYSVAVSIIEGGDHAWVTVPLPEGVAPSDV